jgi:OPA family sugar phosphate sensor protein UhpC-like MFS transporter
MLYLIETRGYSNLIAGICVCCFEVGGFVGNLAAGWSSDILFKGKRNPVNVLFTLAILFLLIAMKFIGVSWYLVDAAILFFFGFFIFGPQMMIGVAAAELSHKKAAATATGFAGCFAYLGAAAAGGPLGAIMNRWGWDSYFLSLTICAIAGVLLLLPLWNVKTNPKNVQRETEPATS